MTQKEKNEMMELATNDFKTANSSMFENVKEKMGIMNNRYGISAEKWKLLKRDRTNEKF